MAIKDKDIEAYKVWTDYIKHLTTLSTGSVVIIATFLEKLFRKPMAKNYVIASLIGFLVTILSSILTFSSIVWDSIFWADEGEPLSPIAEIIQALSVLVALSGFCVGVICLAIFAVKNMQ